MIWKSTQNKIKIKTQQINKCSWKFDWNNVPWCWQDHKQIWTLSQQTITNFEFAHPKVIASVVTHILFQSVQNQNFILLGIQ